MRIESNPPFLQKLFLREGLLSFPHRVCRNGLPQIGQNRAASSRFGANGARGYCARRT